MSALPPLRKSDIPVIDRYYWVKADYMSPGEIIVRAKYVGEDACVDGPSSSMFRVDGHEYLFSVGNEYMVRSDAATLCDTLIHWNESELRRLTDPELLQARTTNLRKHIDELKALKSKEIENE